MFSLLSLFFGATSFDKWYTSAIFLRLAIYLILLEFILKGIVLKEILFYLTVYPFIQKTHEIEGQNEELFQSQENLAKLNDHLEGGLVEARTNLVKKQNERLISYAYTNAHYLRGPVARLLGLIQLSKIDVNLDKLSRFQYIEMQAIEIDEVVKTINRELEEWESDYEIGIPTVLSAKTTYESCIFDCPT